MLMVCIFVPFLHDETPKPMNVVKVPSSRESEQILALKIQSVLELRTRITTVQKKKVAFNSKLL